MSEEATPQPTPDTWRDKGVELFKVWVLPLLALALVMVGVQSWRAPDLPDVAPAFTLRDTDGAKVSLADFRGQTVVLNFWATWCGPCRTEIPQFSWYARRYPQVPVLGIAADGSPGQLKAAGKHLGIDYTILLGDRRTLAAYKVSAYPTTVVVGPDGKVRSAYVGMMFAPQLLWATR